MRGIVCGVSLLAFVGSPPIAAQAGWVAEWQNVPVKSTGERMAVQPSTMSISKGRVRVAQPDSITLIDYNKGRFTLMNPQQEFFWSGSIDEYIAEMSKARAEALRQRAGRKAAQVKTPKVDPGALPPLTIQKTSETKTIAGHETTKYVVHVDGELFQEFWIAPDLNLSTDLDAGKFLAYQQKMSAVRMGKSAGAFNALYRNEEYRKLLETGFILRSVTHHIAGSFERTAASIRSETVPDSAFTVPDSYRRVRLPDVLPDEQQGEQG